jgi:rare lipoprotein A
LTSGTQNGIASQDRRARGIVRAAAVAFGCLPVLIIAAAASSSPEVACGAAAGLAHASLNCLKIAFDPPPEAFAVAEIPPSAPVIPITVAALANVEAGSSDNQAMLADSAPQPTQTTIVKLSERLETTAIALTGAASMYNPYTLQEQEAGVAQTASGEFYDPDTWTAAIQIDLREQFGGVRYGRNYQPTYALVESAGLRAIVKINDVGPLRPGRIIDFNEQTMRYFDPTMRRGVIADVKVTPLAGDDWPPGPVDSPPRISIAAHFE